MQTLTITITAPPDETRIIAAELRRYILNNIGGLFFDNCADGTKEPRKLEVVTLTRERKVQ